MRLIELNDEYYLLGKCAKKGEYSITISGYVNKINDDITFLWIDGCPAILASTKVIEGIPRISVSDTASLWRDNNIYPEYLAKLEYPITLEQTSKGCIDDINEGERYIWISGFNRCLEVNADKRYTHEDMVKCYIDAVNNVGELMKNPFRKNGLQTSEEYIKSITKKRTEWDVDVEMEIDQPINIGTTGTNPVGYTYKIKVNEKGYINILTIK